MPVKSPQQSRSEHTITFIIAIVIKCEVFANAMCITYKYAETDRFNRIETKR